MRSMRCTCADYDDDDFLTKSTRAYIASLIMVNTYLYVPFERPNVSNGRSICGICTSPKQRLRRDYFTAAGAGSNVHPPVIVSQNCRSLNFKS